MKAIAVHTTAVKITVAQTPQSGGNSYPPSTTDAKPLKSAHIASCITVIAYASRPALHLPSEMMCAPKPNALAKTSNSPKPIDQPCSESSAKPSVARATHPHVSNVIRAFKMMAAIRGVNTTYKPVMKPVMAAPVLSSPRVCRMYPNPKKKPAKAERSTKSLVNNLNTFGRSATITTTASAKRLKRKLFTL